VSMRACAFFSPRLDPVLHRGKGDEDAVISPQVPTRRAVGQTVLDDEPYRQIHHTVGRVTKPRHDLLYASASFRRLDFRRSKPALSPGHP